MMNFKDEFNRRVMNAILDDCSQLVARSKVVKFRELECKAGDNHEFILNKDPEFEYDAGYAYSEVTYDDGHCRVYIEVSCRKCGEHWPMLTKDLADGDALGEFMRKITD
jgi:hypothetical protein